MVVLLNNCGVDHSNPCILFIAVQEMCIILNFNFNVSSYTLACSQLGNNVCSEARKLMYSDSCNVKVRQVGSNRFIEQLC